MALKALQLRQGEFPRMATNLRNRLTELSVRNENLDDEIVKRAEQLCEMKEAAIKRFEEVIQEQKDLLNENLKE